MKLTYDAENAISGCLTAYNVSELLINGISTNMLKMDFDDGEIEELELFENLIYLNASWQDYMMKTSTCEEIHISAEKTDWINGDYPNTKHDIRKCLEYGNVIHKQDGTWKHNKRELVKEEFEWLHKNNRNSGGHI